MIVILLMESPFSSEFLVLLAPTASQAIRFVQSLAIPFVQSLKA